MNKMAAPTGQHGKYLFWLQLLNRLSDFHTVFTDDLRKKCSLFPDQGDWCHSSPLRPIPTKHCCRLTAIVGRLLSADWIGVQISNMFNMGSQPTGMKSVVESAESGLESADYSTDSNTDSAKVGVLVQHAEI